MKTRKKRPILDRFNEAWMAEPNTGCYLWIKATDKNGYGVIKRSGERLMIKAHRLSWILSNGEIPDNLCVLHKCDTPQCVNPEHLFLGTPADNNIDKMNKGRCNSYVKQTFAVICQIRDEYRLGASYEQLAVKYNYNPGHIAQIILMKRRINR